MSLQDDFVSSTPAEGFEVETFEEEYVVERILDKKVENGQVFYLIKWQGFEGQDTWEPEAHVIDCPELIADFEDRVLAETEEGTEVVDHVRPMTRSRQRQESIETPIMGFARGLEPDKILGLTDCDGEIHFLIEWKGSDVTDLVPRLEANQKCPQLVIKFYEEKISWHTNRTATEIYGEEEPAEASESGEED